MIYDVYRRKVNVIYNVYKLRSNYYPACGDKKQYADIIYTVEEGLTLNKNDIFIDFEYENIGYEKFATKKIDNSLSRRHYKDKDYIFIENKKYLIDKADVQNVYVDDVTIVDTIGYEKALELYKAIRDESVKTTTESLEKEIKKGLKFFDFFRIR